jgi:hypothetical protein
MAHPSTVHSLNGTVRQILVTPSLRHFFDRLRQPTPDQIVKAVDTAIIEEMIECLQRMRPPKKKNPVRRSPLDRGRATQIIRAALAITGKWTLENQNRDLLRFRDRDARNQAEWVVKRLSQLNSELGWAARNPALRDKLERPAKTSDFDREMLEEWLPDIVALTGIEDGELPGGRDILDAWDVMHPIVRNGVERQLRNESAGSIRAALIRIPVLINRELRALEATKLPHVRVLQRRLDALFRQFGLGFGSVLKGESRSQQFARIAQKAIGVQQPVLISRHQVQDEKRRKKILLPRRAKKR